MFEENIGSTRALIHLLDVLPESEERSVLAKLEGALARTRRLLVHRLAEDMNRLVTRSCEEMADIAGIAPERFFDFCHPDCEDRICRGTRVEILRIDRTVGGELSCLCRVLRKTRITACSLRPYRLVALSGRLETSRGSIASGQAVLVSPEEPVQASPGATFLLPNPMATYLISDAIRAGFSLQRPGHGSTHLRLVSARPHLRTDESGGERK